MPNMQSTMTKIKNRVTMIGPSLPPWLVVTTATGQTKNVKVKLHETPHAKGTVTIAKNVGKVTLNPLYLTLPSDRVTKVLMTTNVGVAIRAAMIDKSGEKNTLKLNKIVMINVAKFACFLMVTLVEDLMQVVAGAAFTIELVSTEMELVTKVRLTCGTPLPPTNFVRRVSLTSALVALKNVISRKTKMIVYTRGAPILFKRPTLIVNAGPTSGTDDMTRDGVPTNFAISFKTVAVMTLTKTDFGIPSVTNNVAMNNLKTAS